VNGYAGAAWSSAACTTALAQRPVFGTVRSMTFSGAARKFDVRAFVSRWSGPEPA
jgi:deoxyribodipyrimidine photo-lyase